MAVPDIVGCGYGPVVAFLLQGVADGRRVARRTCRQAQRRDDNLPVVPVPERACQPPCYSRRIADNGRQHSDVGEVNSVGLIKCLYN